MDEIDILREISRLLNSLESDQRSRVISWLSDKYSDEQESSSAQSDRGKESESISDETRIVKPESQSSQMQNFPDYFASVNPQTDAERALVSSYWLQIKEGKESVRAYDVNALLKDLGHPINNITRAFDHLQSKSPQLIIQIRKKGRSQQARKRYRVTQAGIDKVTKNLKSQGGNL